MNEFDYLQYLVYLWDDFYCSSASLRKKNVVLKPAIADRWQRFQRIGQQALELFEDEEKTKR